MRYRQTISGTTYTFDGLVDVLAKATPLRSGDQLAGCAADSDAQRAAAAWALADIPLATFLTEAVVPYETDEVTRLIVDGHDREAFGLEPNNTVVEQVPLVLAAVREFPLKRVGKRQDGSDYGTTAQ